MNLSLIEVVVFYCFTSSLKYFICFVNFYILLCSLQDTGSSLCLVFGLENSVDFLSSVIVLWRFFAPGKATEEVEKRLRKREERASMGISIVMGLLGIFVIVGAVDDFLQGEDEPKHQDLILGISFFR